MPTAYTEPVVEGKITSVADFMKDCSRAFLWYMREENRDAEVARKVPKTDSYCSKRIVELLSELDEVSLLSEDEAAERAEKEYRDTLESYVDTYHTYMIENQRLQDMIDCIKKIHFKESLKEFRDFLIEQLTVSFQNSSYYENAFTKLSSETPLSGETWKRETIKAIKASIAYYKTREAEEISNREETQRWLDDLFQLIDSLENS